ncbi:hypothetical protein Enr13x_38100 [Stieleria neptunia]|uniref:Uncharacterized protein n=2 Tax=Stieleria neptunia TaxID=2527979 RepID=A0A518HSW8_9BACT|nr:hypothetical protein [Stieleria neptunia]QDV43812.1 hypothetical protein Enr13x_36720 [Stieleria neptunia]QDV43950.1 hypothetical protein Enr13x_38100 [Stieleria neptunia]
MTNEKKAPVHTVRVGNVEAAIWVNDSKNGSFYSTTFSRKYRTDDGVKNSDSYSGDALLRLAKAADLAHTWTAENPLVQKQEAA